MTGGASTQPEPDTIPLGTWVAGRYRLERLLGKGGFGAVFAAQSAHDGSRVALKVLSARVLEMSGGADRMRREAELARRLTHPNVVRVLDSGIDERGTLFIAFELLQGRSLEEEILSRGALTPARAGAIACEVLAALEHAHGAGVVHRDLKPANIFLLGGQGTQERVKVLDFGIAKSTNANTRAGLTQDGTTLGTPAYMSPEQMMGTGVGPATDLFALGVVIAEMLLGRPLYGDSGSALAILNERLSGGRIPLPQHLGRTPLGAVILTATEPSAARRYPDAAAMNRAVRSALAQGGATSDRLAATAAAQPITMAFSGAPVDAMGAGNQGFGHQSTVAVQTGPTGHVASGPHVAPAGPAGAQPLRPSRGALAATVDEPSGRPRAALARTVQDDGRASSRAPLWIAGVVFALGLVAAIVVGVMWWLRVRADEEKARAREKREARLEREEEARDSTRDPAPGALADAPPEPTPPTAAAPPVAAPPAAGRALPCAGIDDLDTSVLKSKLAAAGLGPSGTSVYCAGDLVNFVCNGPQAKGSTLAGGGAAGVFRVDDAAKAEALAHRLAGTTSDVFLFGGARVVVLSGVPEAGVERAIGALCASP